MKMNTFRDTSMYLQNGQNVSRALRAGLLSESRYSGTRRNTSEITNCASSGGWNNTHDRVLTIGPGIDNSRYA